MATQDAPRSSRLLPEPPPVPHYDAVPSEVEKFLTEYFQSQLCLSESASLAMAQKLPISGPALFKASQGELQEIYGLNATPLFDHLQDSIYGPNTKIWGYAPMAASVVSALCALITALVFFNGRKASIKWTASFGVVFDVLLFLLYRFCARRNILTNPNFPEWAKARKWGSASKERNGLWRT